MQGIILAAAAHSLFAVANVFLKQVTTDLPVYSAVFWHDVFALVAVFAFHRQLGGFRATVRTRYLKYHLLRAVFLSIQFIALIGAVSLMPLDETYSIFFTVPILTTLLAIPFLKQKPAGYHWLALVCGLGGVLMILGPQAGEMSAGIWLALLSALMLAFANLAAAKIGPGETKLSYAFYAILSTLIVSGILALQDFQIPEAGAFLLLAGAGVMAGIAVMLVGMAFSMAAAAPVSALMYVQMIWAVALGWLIFGDRPLTATLLGAGLIIGGGLYMIYRENGVAKKSGQ